VCVQFNFMAINRKKVLSGIINFKEEGKFKKPVVIYNETTLAIDRRQIEEVARRFKENQSVLFYTDIPFVATLRGVKFVKPYFEEYYDKQFSF